MRRKIAAILSAAVMAAVSLAGCGSTGENSSLTQEESSLADTETEHDESKGDEEPYTVKIVAYGDATTQEADKVAEKMSEISRELYNIDIELVKGYTVEQLNLMLTSGEKLDLFPVMPWELSLSSLAGNEQLIAMDDLLAEYGSDTLSAISDSDWACAKINGQTYGVPMNKDKANSSGFAMRKDVVDQLGIDYTGLNSYETIEKALRLVKEKTDYYPLVSSIGGLQGFLPFDGLGDDLGVLESVFSDSTTVVNWYETETYIELVNTMWRWAQEGLIMPDATSNTDSSMTVIGAKGFATFGKFKPGVVNQASAEAGTELVISEIYPGHTTTSNVASTWSIPSNSEKPEKAMMILDLLYNNSEFANLFTNGIEGEHYVYADKENNVIDYPEGKNANSTGYTVFSWAVPNQLITSIRTGDEADLWEQLTEFNNSAKDSPAKGFAWDNSKVLNEITACLNVVNKYKNGLELGALNPDEVLPKFNEELKAAGIDTIISEKQAQLDAWLAQK